MPAPRRTFLASIGFGLVGLGSVLDGRDVGAFSATTANRGTNVTVASDEANALVGLVVADHVQRNSRETLVEVTNNVGVDLSVTVSLDACTQGTLFGPGGEGPCSVTFSLPTGGTETVEVESDVKDTTISFTTSASAQEFSFEAVRQTDAVAGNADAPTADAGGPYQVEEGDSVPLDGTNSQGNVKEYEWQIVDGSGSLSDATTATPVYHAPAVDDDTSVTVELTVTNNDGLSDSDEATVTVQDTPGDPPVIDDLSVTKTGSKNRKFQVEANVSDSDGDLSRVEITAVRTNNGNEDYRNTISVSGSTASVQDTTSQLANKAEYEVRVEVFDSGGRSTLETRRLTTG